MKRGLSYRKLQKKTNGDTPERVTVFKTVCKWLTFAVGADAAVTAREFLNATCGVNELLLASKERVAGGADTNT